MAYYAICIKPDDAVVKFVRKSACEIKILIIKRCYNQIQQFPKVVVAWTNLATTSWEKNTKEDGNKNGQNQQL